MIRRLLRSTTGHLKFNRVLWLLAALLASAHLASAQVILETGKRLQIPEPGATAAVSLNTKVATATILNNRLIIVGISPGDVRVVALYPANIAEVRVHVAQSPAVYPPGFIPPTYRGNGSGSFEGRFSSDRMQFENILDLTTQTAIGSSALHIASATFPEDAQSTSFVPSAYYRITLPQMQLTLLDETVEDSPLTLDNVVLRGLHVRYHRWNFHGGYTTSADFSDVFIPVQKELAAGISYSQPIRRFFHLIPHLYFLRSIDLENGQQRSAMIGSVLFRGDFSENWKFETEVAAGRGMGFAAGLEHYGTDSTLRATLTKKSLDFPSLRSSSLPGLNGDVSWSQVFTPKIGLVSGATIDHIELSRGKQNTEDAYATLRYKFHRSLSVGTGVSHQSFSGSGSTQDANPAFYSSRTLTLPQQINFDHPAFGLGYQYQFATTSHAFSNGNGQRQTLRLDVKRYQLGEFIDLQTDAVGLQSVYSQLPQVQNNLQRQALVAATPADLAVLLRSAAFLQSVGVAGQAQLLTVPRRLQEGGSVAWSSHGPRPHQLSVSAFSSHDRYAASTTNEYSISGSYAKEIGVGNQLQFSASAVQSSLSGQQQLMPVVSFSFRHLLTRSPEILSADRSFSINGTVFVDARGGGVYEDGMDSLAQITIVLDNQRTVVTNNMGNFYFGGLSSGMHKVRMIYATDRAHYFTTPQEVTVEANSIVNFGIHFPAVDLWGYVEDDAGGGLENILLLVKSPTGTMVVSTTKSGKFSVPDVPPGSYQVQVDLESVPVGHSTEDLEPVEVLMTASSSAHPVIRIPAIRVLSGTVTLYDAAAGAYLPVKGAVVRVAALDKTAVTTSQGKFTLGGLPSGNVEVTITAGTAVLNQVLYLPVQPATLREDYKVSSLSGKISATLKGVTLDGVK